MDPEKGNKIQMFLMNKSNFHNEKTYPYVNVCQPLLKIHSGEQCKILLGTYWGEKKLKFSL